MLISKRKKIIFETENGSHFDATKTNFIQDKLLILTTKCFGHEKYGSKIDSESAEF